MNLNQIYLPDYIFYKIYRFGKFLKVRIPETSVCAVLTILLSVPVVNLIIYLSQIYPVLKNKEKWGIFIIGVSIYILLTFYFVISKRYIHIEERYKDENPIFKKITDLIFIAFLIAYIIFIFIRYS